MKKLIIESSAQQLHHHSPGCCRKKKKIIFSSAQQVEEEDVVTGSELRGLAKLRNLFSTPKKAEGRPEIIESKAQEEDGVEDIPVFNQDGKTKDISQ